MQGHRAGNRTNRNDRPSRVFTIPPDLRHRLAAWIDVDAVGADGFWLWLGTVLPLLPSTVTTGAGPRVRHRHPGTAASGATPGSAFA